jgi:hypothetical protein
MKSMARDSELTDEKAILTVFEGTRQERELMGKAARHMISIMQKQKLEGTSLEHEFATFVQHFGNIKGFLNKRAREAAPHRIALITSFLRYALSEGYDDLIEEQLNYILAYEIDYNSKPWKKFHIGLGLHGLGVSGEKA